MRRSEGATSSTASGAPWAPTVRDGPEALGGTAALTRIGEDMESTTENRPRIRTRVACAECGRVFDLMNEDQAGEWYYGHDCEA
jgi:hypothetical protein